MGLCFVPEHGSLGGTGTPPRAPAPSKGDRKSEGRGSPGARAALGLTLAPRCPHGKFLPCAGCAPRLAWQPRATREASFARFNSVPPQNNAALGLPRAPHLTLRGHGAVDGTKSPSLVGKTPPNVPVPGAGVIWDLEGGRVVQRASGGVGRMGEKSPSGCWMERGDTAGPGAVRGEPGEEQE